MKSISKFYILSLTVFVLSFLIHLNTLSFWEKKRADNHDSKKRKRDVETFNVSWSRVCPPIDDQYTLSPPLKYNGNCYYVSVNESFKLSWDGAKSYCESKNSALLIIDTLGEIDYLKRFSIKRLQNLSSKTFWIQKSAVQLNEDGTRNRENFEPGDLQHLCPELNYIPKIIPNDQDPETIDGQVIYKPVILQYTKESKSCAKQNYFICESLNFDSAVKIVEKDEQFTGGCDLTFSLSFQNPVIAYKSSNYPNLYPNNLDCNITIINNDPGTNINIHFKAFNLEPSLGCNKDFLEVSSFSAIPKSKINSNHWVPIMDDKMLIENSQIYSQMIDLNKGRYCGDWGKRIKLLQFQTDPDDKYKNTLLRFVTNGKTSGTGFSFRAYLELKRDTSMQNKIKSRIVRLKDLKGGTYSSPNYPYFYSDNTNITVIIEAPAHSRIEIKFNFFDVEYQEECLYDYISVTDEGGIGPVRFCGKLSSIASLARGNRIIDAPLGRNHHSDSMSSYIIVPINDSLEIDNSPWSPFNFVSADNKVIIKFYSDQTNHGLGFVFKWSILDLQLCTDNSINASTEITQDTPQTVQSFARLDIPFIRCRSQFTALKSTYRIYVQVYDIQIDRDVIHVSCLQEYIVIRENDDLIPETQNYSIKFNLSPNKNIQDGKSLIICPKDEHNWQTKYFSKTSKVDVWYIKNTRDNAFLSYKIKFYIAEQLELQEYIYTDKTHMGLFTSLNYPLPQPYNALYRIVLIASQKGRIKLFAKGITYQHVSNTSLTIKRFKRYDQPGCKENQNIISIIDPFTSINGSLKRHVYCGIHSSKSQFTPSNSDPAQLEQELQQYQNVSLKNIDESVSTGSLVYLAESKLHALIVEIASLSSNKSLTPIMFLWDILPDEDFSVKIKDLSNPFHDCSINLCSNNGTCISENECSCMRPYKDKFCLTNPCETSPCVYGVCKITSQTFACDCDKMHLGSLCQFEICDTNICNNQGICHLENGTEVCVCYNGYAGDRCGQTFPIIRDLSPSEKFFQEPFWMGIFLVIIVLIILGLIMLYQKKWAGEYKLICCDDCFTRRAPKNILSINHRPAASPKMIKNDEEQLDPIDMLIKNSHFPRRATSPDVGGVAALLSPETHKSTKIVKTSTE